LDFSDGGVEILASSELGANTASFKIALKITAVVLPANGCRPVAISYSTASERVARTRC
jgi:hypothetical protein